MGDAGLHARQSESLRPDAKQPEVPLKIQSGPRGLRDEQRRSVPSRREGGGKADRAREHDPRSATRGTADFFL